VFPVDYTAPLASICRIIKGLVDGTSPIECNTSGRNVVIKKFA